MSRPTVSASFHQDAQGIKAHAGGEVTHTPGVHVEVDFKLHSHKAALAALDYAVADVRQQIEEAG